MGQFGNNGHNYYGNLALQNRPYDPQKLENFVNAAVSIVNAQPDPRMLPNFLNAAAGNTLGCQVSQLTPTEIDILVMGVQCAGNPALQQAVPNGLKISTQEAQALSIAMNAVGVNLQQPGMPPQLAMPQNGYMPQQNGYMPQQNGYMPPQPGGAIPFPQQPGAQQHSPEE